MLNLWLELEANMLEFMSDFLRVFWLVLLV